MSRWKGLPAELDPRVRHLVVRLRRLKDHSGLSMRQLAAKTGYSTSSWERYLGGRSLPPREAVEAIASVTGEDPTRLLALREVAAAAWTGSRASGGTTTAEAPAQTVITAPEPEPGLVKLGPAQSGPAESGPAQPGPAQPGPAQSGPMEPGPMEPSRADRAQDPVMTELTAVEPARPRGRSLQVALVAAVVALVLAGASAAVLVTRLTGDQGATARTSASASVPAAAQNPQGPAPKYTCRIERADGRWYAGHSRTREALLWRGHSGPKVAEAQCLLRRAGFSPGDIDGIYGPLTERAVKRLQKKYDLVVDGIVGPHTWGALRR
ncbi:peptidoglycan-binding protein [Streptomyces thermospinosisporus]